MNQSITSPDGLSPLPGLHRFTVLLAAVTLLLIFVGGLVTSTGSALAVPDWPLSFGKFFPKMQGGVLYEHGHRMVAGTVAILTLAMALWATMRERRPWVRKLAWGAAGLVVVQAVLGGLTVLLLLPLAIAVAHAATAQAFFCLTIALAAVTNTYWEAPPSPRLAGERPPLPMLAAATTAVIYAQILIGAVMRHMGAGLAIPDFPLSYGHLIPPLEATAVVVNFAHRCGALVVALMTLWTAAQALRFYSGEALIRRPALLMISLLIVQITLGALTIWTYRAVLPTTAHVAVGAALLGTSFLLSLRTHRLLEQAAPHPFPGLAKREAAL